MSLFQIILIFILIYAFYRGYKKGFLSQLATFLGLFLAYSFTSVFYQKLHIYLIKHSILGETDTQYLSYILCFILIITLVNIFAFVIEKILKMLKINIVNKFLGGFLSLLVAGFILSLVVHLGISLHIFNKPNIENPDFIYYLNEFGQLVLQHYFN